MLLRNSSSSTLSPTAEGLSVRRVARQTAAPGGVSRGARLSVVACGLSPCTSVPAGVVLALRWVAGGGVCRRRLRPLLSPLAPRCLRGFGLPLRRRWASGVALSVVACGLSSLPLHLGACGGLGCPCAAVGSPPPGAKPFPPPGRPRSLEPRTHTGRTRFAAGYAPSNHATLPLGLLRGPDGLDVTGCARGRGYGGRG